MRRRRRRKESSALKKHRSKKRVPALLSLGSPKLTSPKLTSPMLVSPMLVSPMLVSPMLVSSMRDRLRIGNRREGLGSNDSLWVVLRDLAPSGGPTRADLIFEDQSRAVPSSVDRTLDRRVVRKEEALRRSANCFTRGRRFWFRSPKSRSPKRARVSLLTLRYRVVLLFICRRSITSAYLERYQTKWSASG